MKKHPKYAEIIKLHVSNPDLSQVKIAKQLDVSRGVVAGIVFRHDHPGGDVRTKTRKPSRCDWGEKVFETWADRKARLARERRTAT